MTQNWFREKFYSKHLQWYKCWSSKSKTDNHSSEFWTWPSKGTVSKFRDKEILTILGLVYHGDPNNKFCKIFLTKQHPFGGILWQYFEKVSDKAVQNWDTEEYSRVFLRKYFSLREVKNSLFEKCFYISHDLKVMLYIND